MKFLISFILILAVVIKAKAKICTINFLIKQLIINYRFCHKFNRLNIQNSIFGIIYTKYMRNLDLL
jgi:hypothetical protein